MQQIIFNQSFYREDTKTKESRKGLFVILFRETLEKKLNYLKRRTNISDERFLEIFKEISIFIEEVKYETFKEYENHIQLLSEVVLFPFPEKCYPRKEDHSGAYMQFVIFMKIFYFYQNPRDIFAEYLTDSDFFVDKYLENMFYKLIYVMFKNFDDISGIVFKREFGKNNDSPGLYHQKYTDQIKIEKAYVDSIFSLLNQ